MPRDFSVLALIAAYNEADILPAVTRALIDEGVGVYLLDHGSTDGTRQALEPLLGHGLLAIEPFPGDRFPEARDRFSWGAILERKRELSMELDADWFIHHDADEFRESIWDGLSLRDAILRVDELGYNAIDFEVFNFWPTDDAFVPGTDPRETIRHYGPNDAWNKLQVKCWKKMPVAPDLVSSGGHDVMFPGRRVFPLRFLLRHYPVRGQRHGERKVFAERRPRFLDQERSKGWHVQYDAFGEDVPFVKAAEALTGYDPVKARLYALSENRRVDDLVACLDHQTQRLARREDTIRVLQEELGRRTEEAAAARALLQEELERRTEAAAAAEARIEELEAQRRRCEEHVTNLETERVSAGAQVEELRGELTRADHRIETAEARSKQADREGERLVAELEAHRQQVRRLGGEMEALHASKSWRWMAPLRALYRMLGRR